MGLDLCCHDEQCHLTYSGVQKIRYNILKATLEYLINNKDKLIQYYKNNFITNEEDYESEYINNQLNIVEKYLISLLSPSTSLSFCETPNYSKIDPKYNDKLKMFGIYGIIPIIEHSDYDGFYTSGEAEDFMDVLEIIYKYIPASDFYDDEVKLENYYMYHVMKKSITTKTPIRFA
jgi:hypothetical protein